MTKEIRKKGKVRTALVGLSSALLVLTLTGAGSAQGVSRWRTPDGRLYFGEDPPKGSISLDAVGTPAWQVVKASPVIDGPVPGTERDLQKRHDEIANSIKVGPYNTRADGFFWVFKGKLRNAGSERIHSVEVGALGEWVRAEPSTLEPGEEGHFSLRVPYPPGEARSNEMPEVEARCLEQSLLPSTGGGR